VFDDDNQIDDLLDIIKTFDPETYIETEHA